VSERVVDRLEIVDVHDEQRALRPVALAARAVEAREAVTRFGFAVVWRGEVALVVAVAPSVSRPRTLPRPHRNDVISALSMTCSSSRSVRARIALTDVTVSGKAGSFVSG
jgi:hypothetical protein